VLPYDQREAFKWQRSSEQMRSRMKRTDNLVWVCDREADIHEYVANKITNNERFIVRAAQDRAVRGEEGRLWAFMQAQPKRYERTVEVRQRGKQTGTNPRVSRPARKATVEVRAAAITLTPKSKKPGNDKRSAMSLNAVYVCESSPPEGVEPLEWMLLTKEPIETEAQIEQVISGYESRWVIEEFHRSWKSGCRLEQRRLQSPSNLRRLGAILAFVAVRIMQLRAEAMSSPESPCDKLLDEDHWQCLHAGIHPDKPLPSTAPTLDWALKAIAQLGGWIQTKAGMPPGYLTVWKGWMKLKERVQGWRLARQQILATAVEDTT